MHFTFEYAWKLFVDSSLGDVQCSVQFCVCLSFHRILVLLSILVLVEILYFCKLGHIREGWQRIVLYWVVYIVI